MAELDADDNDGPVHSHGQVLPPTPTPTPDPFFKDRDSSAAVTFETLTSGKGANERVAAFISQLMYVQERISSRLELQASENDAEIQSNGKMIADLRVEVAKLEGEISLLKEKSEGAERRLREAATREKTAIGLAGLLITLGIGILDKESATGAILILVGALCGAAGIFPKVMGTIFKDANT